MKEDLQKYIQSSREELDKISKAIEERYASLTEEAKEYSKALKTYISGIEETLKKAEDETQLQSHLMMMEAKEKMEEIKDDLDTFLSHTAQKGQEELDLLALKAHLLKLETESFWEEKRKSFSRLYSQSQIEATRLADKAVHELNTIMMRLSELL